MNVLTCDSFRGLLSPFRESTNFGMTDWRTTLKRSGSIVMVPLIDCLVWSYGMVSSLQVSNFLDVLRILVFPASRVSLLSVDESWQKIRLHFLCQDSSPRETLLAGKCWSFTHSARFSLKIWKLALQCPWAIHFDADAGIAHSSIKLHLCAQQLNRVVYHITRCADCAQTAKPLVNSICILGSSVHCNQLL